MGIMAETLTMGNLMALNYREYKNRPFITYMIHELFLLVKKKLSFIN